MFNRIIETLAVPIVILNLVGGIVGGIWLAFLGEWKLIGIGILFPLASVFLVLPLLMIPAILISRIAVQFAEKNKFLFYLFGFLSQSYTNILIVATCVAAFFICSSFYKGYNVGADYIPYALWSWGMALSPWQFFASKEADNEFTAISLFSVSLFYLLFLGSIFISPILSLIMGGIFVLVQLFVLPIFNMYLANKIDNPETAKNSY